VDRSGKQTCPTVVKVIACNRCDDHVFETEGRHNLRNPHRFIVIDLSRYALGHITESAAACADIA
jgi:hypothetical protein